MTALNTRTLRPRDFKTRGMQRVIEWHLLLAEMEEITGTATVGLALIWGSVHRGNYQAARSALDRYISGHHFLADADAAPSPRYSLDQDSLPITEVTA